MRKTRRRFRESNLSKDQASRPAYQPTTHALDFPAPVRERRRCSVTTAGRRVAWGAWRGCRDAIGCQTREVQRLLHALQQPVQVLSGWYTIEHKSLPIRGPEHDDRYPEQVLLLQQGQIGREVQPRLVV